MPGIGFRSRLTVSRRAGLFPLILARSKLSLPEDCLGAIFPDLAT
jgi:hypothetical protein